MRKYLLVAVALMLILAFAGCTRVAHPERGTGDAPVDMSKRDSSAPYIYEFPNLFGNIASKCDHFGHRLYVTTNRDNFPSNVVVITDPTCKG